MIRMFIMTLCLLLLTSALMAGGFALSGVGARAISMGGAMRGLADDYSAMYWNPAGLAYFDHSQFSATFASIKPGTTYEADGLNWPGITENDKITANEKLWAFPNLYYIHQAECKWNYGIGFYVPYGLGAEWDFFTPPSTMTLPTGTTIPITWTNVEKTDFKSSIMIADLHPAVSYKFSDKLSVGMGLSINYGIIEIQKLYPNKNASGVSLLTYLPTNMDLNGTGWGAGANFGLLYKPSNMLSIGVSGKLPTTMYMHGDADITTYVNSGIATYIDADTTSSAAYQATSHPTEKAKLKLPADAGLGIAVHPVQALTVTTDVTWTGWSRLDKIVLQFDGKSPDLPYLGKPATEMPDTDLNTDWEDVVRFSAGLEYKFGAHFGLDALTARCGYHYDPTPIPDSSLNPTWPDVGDISSYNLGLGFTRGHYSLDLGYETMTFTDRTIGTEEWTSTNKPDNMVGHYDTWLNAFNATLSYSF